MKLFYLIKYQKDTIDNHFCNEPNDAICGGVRRILIILYYIIMNEL